MILNRCSGVGPNRLSEERRDELLELLRTLRWSFLSDLPPFIDPEAVREGVEAAGLLLIYWSQDSAQRRTYYSEAVADWHAYAGSLQSLCEAASLREEIEMRAAKNAAKGVVIAAPPLLFGDEAV